MVVMKYFRYILIGHEIFFKIFDEPITKFFVILFFKLMGIGAQDIQTRYQGDLKKTRHVK